jgi:dihydrofolate synthase/folylpolyglutamate synthase
MFCSFYSVLAARFFAKMTMNRDSDYNKVTDYIFRLRRFGEMKLGLGRVENMLGRLSNPENKLKCVHIAGTNGKGSTAAMLSSVLSCAGYSVGMYTSPHLSDYTERIRVGSRQIDPGEVVALFGKMMPLVGLMQKEDCGSPTFFEFTTALALEYFFEKNVDIAVIEVGLGGRLDATNVITPLVSVITNIGLEHTDILGDTREKIAKEKAGIIKKGVPLVTAADPEMREIFRKSCLDAGSEIYSVGVGSDIEATGRESSTERQLFDAEGLGRRYRGVECRLIGSHQLSNAGCAFGVVRLLNERGFGIGEEAYRRGMGSVAWPGRLEIVQREPTVVLDCAKDPSGMRVLREALTSLFRYSKLITIIGVSSDKQIPTMLDEIVPVSDLVIATKHHVMGRTAEPSLLARMISERGGHALVAEDVSLALDMAHGLADRHSLICVAGSVFVVGEARERWRRGGVIWGRETNETRRQVQDPDQEEEEAEST